MINRLAITTILIIVLASAFAPFITGKNPVAIDLDGIKEPPSWRHLMGTDAKGRDVLARILYGGRVSLSVALVAAVVSLFIGLVVGLSAGYFGGWWDTALMALADLVLSFPSLLLAIGVSVLMPNGVFTVMAAIATVGWASFARLMRAQTLKIKQMAFIDAARAVGCGDFRIITRHVLPQCLPVGMVMAGLKFGGYILTEAALSFLGLGPQPPSPSWGAMISENRAYIISEPWMVFFPGLAIAITALCFNLVGDFLQDKYGLKASR
jgi:ABC-type dipeptide/oligopeptide/nickel transport system permease subunit